MALPATAEKLRYTFEDMLGWDDAERYELIEGEPCMMAPASHAHQYIGKRLFRQLDEYLDGKTCEAYYGLGVRPFEGKGDRPRDTDTVLVPDLMVVCDPEKLDEHGCKGAPDMAIEIQSPSTRRRDWLVKTQLYQKAGVKEYWIVSPGDRSVHVFLLEGEQLVLREVCGHTDTVKVNVLDGCEIDLSTVFPPEGRK